MRECVSVVLTAAFLGRTGNGPSDQGPCSAGLDEDDTAVSISGGGGDYVVSATNCWQTVTSFCSILLQLGSAVGNLWLRQLPFPVRGPKGLLELRLQYR